MASNYPVSRSTGLDTDAGAHVSEHMAPCEGIVALCAQCCNGPDVPTFPVPVQAKSEDFRRRFAFGVYPGAVCNTLKIKALSDQ